MANSYISTIEDLEFWYKQLKTPTWNLYRGWHEKMPVRNIIYKQDEEDMDLQESFNLLKNMIEMNAHQGGKFTIYVNNAQKGSSILVGLNLDRIRTPGYSSGLGGYGSGVGMVPSDEVDRRINQALKIHQLEREVEDLAADREARMGFSEVLMEKLREVDLGPIISGLAALLQPRTGAIQGVPVQPQPPVAAPAHDPEEGFNYDGERVINTLDRIRPSFESDAQFYQFLDRVSSRFEENPDMFKNMM